MTKEIDYWNNFWNSNPIISRDGIHEKVGRTVSGIPISDKDWHCIVEDIQQHLQLNSNDSVLDIAAGSGALAIPLSKKVFSYLALDISAKLLVAIPQLPNLKTLLADAKVVQFENESFNKIVLYFALQHFSEAEVILLFNKTYNWLSKGGIFYVGDIPDENKKFDFFNTPQRVQAYINSIETNQPIIGTWFHPIFLKELALQIGFKNVEILYQPKNYINAHYRFDIKLMK